MTKPKTKKMTPGKSQFQDMALEALQAEPRSADLKRASILQAVVSILAKEGVDELTFEKIGKRVQMARSHVVYYFPNREELVVAAIRFAAMSADSTIRRHMEDRSEWRDLLRGYIEGNFIWIKENPSHATVYALLYYLSTFKPEYRKLHSEIRKVGANRIESILMEGPMKSRKRELATLVKAIQGIITGNLVDVMSTDQLPQLEQRKSETVRSVENLVAGY